MSRNQNKEIQSYSLPTVSIYYSRRKGRSIITQKMRDSTRQVHSGMTELENIAEKWTWWHRELILIVPK